MPAHAAAAGHRAPQATETMSPAMAATVSMTACPELLEFSIHINLLTQSVISDLRFYDISYDN
jgi:hypothetical protein